MKIVAGLDVLHVMDMARPFRIEVVGGLSCVTLVVFCYHTQKDFNFLAYTFFATMMLLCVRIFIRSVCYDI